MSNYQFLQGYQKLQYGIMFDQLINLDFARIGYCEKDKTTFWNFALTDKKLSESELSQIEQVLQTLDRKSAVYWENKDDLKLLAGLLVERGYKKDYEDSWMFYKGQDIDRTRFNQVKKVENEKDLKIFLNTLNDCYQKDDPHNPYGELGDYLTVAEKVWHRNHTTNRLEYFIAYKEERPVAVATLTSYGGLGYISNVGSLRDVRGKGYGKLSTLYCVERSRSNGNTEHCLATEEGTFPNEFYKRIGFDTRFTTVCYTKTE